MTVPLYVQRKKSRKMRDLHEKTPKQKLGVFSILGEVMFLYQ